MKTIIFNNLHETVKQRQPWRYDKEGETILFSYWNFYLFELSFLFINQWFPTDLVQ